MPVMPTVAAGPPAEARDGAMRVHRFLGEQLAMDPDFALAHANLGIYFFTLVVIGLLHPADGMPAARASANRALGLDPALPEAHALLALVRGVYDYEWDDAGQMFGEAWLGPPVAPTVRCLYAIWYLSPLERHTEAVAVLEGALAEEPGNLLARVHLAAELDALGRTTQGQAVLEVVLAADPAFGPALGFRGRSLALMDRVDDALACARGTFAVLPTHPNAIGFLAGMLRRTGDGDGSRALLDGLHRRAAPGVARARAEAHLACGEVDAAAGWIANAVIEKDPGVWLLLAGVFGQRVRQHPCWAPLAARLNLHPARIESRQRP